MIHNHVLDVHLAFSRMGEANSRDLQVLCQRMSAARRSRSGCRGRFERWRIGCFLSNGATRQHEQVEYGEESDNACRGKDGYQRG